MTRLRRLRAISAGGVINDDVVRYAVAGSSLTARMAVATVLIAGGAPEFTSSKSGGGLELDGNGKELLTVLYPREHESGDGRERQRIGYCHCD